jgi:outer membrane protein assembly factor BamB
LKIRYKTALLLSTAALGLSACSTFDRQGQTYNVNAFWAQDTLKQPNYKFRKINRMTPVIHKNSLVVGNALDGLVSYDLRTFNEQWRLAIPQGVEASGVAVRETLFVGSNNGKVYSVDMTKGTVNWEFDTKSEVVAEPLLDEGVLFFISGSQSVYALDASNGKQIWIYSRQDTSGGMTVRGGSKPALSKGVLYTGFSDGSLVALNAKTGTEQWEITLNRNTRFKDIDSSPVIDENILLINSYDDKLYSISKNKGEIMWSSPYGGQTTPLIDGDRIFSSSSRGEMVALNKKDGALLWKRDTVNGVYVDPTVFNSVILTGESQGKLLMLNKIDGSVTGSFEPGRGVFSKPVTQQNKIYFISGEGNLYGIEARYQDKSEIDYLK